MTNEELEELAKQFYKETGFLAPFKDAPARVGGDPHYAQALRRQEWDRWIKARKKMTVREEIAQWLAMRFVYGRDNEFNPLNYSGFSESERKTVLKDADQILSIKGLRIEAENQELPEINYGVLLEGLPSQSINLYRDAQQDMLEAGWVKCEKEGTWNRY